MRRFFDLMTRQNIFHQLGDLIRHVGDEPVQPVELASLIENDGVEFVDGVERMGEVDLELLDPGFLVVGHWRLLRLLGAVSFATRPVSVDAGILRERRNTNSHHWYAAGLQPARLCIYLYVILTRTGIHQTRECRMTDLSDFEISRKWPATHPDRIQLYSLPTPNGIKVSAMLEETGLPYEPHLVDFGSDDQLSPEFLSLNPNNKIPAMIDPLGPGGEPLPLWESGAILIYLAEKSGKFLPKDPAKRAETLQWLMWQMGGFGPMAGQLGFFHKFAGREYEDRRPFERYRDETRRLLGVLDRQLEGREFIIGNDYTIADMACWPWARNINGFYEAGEVTGFASFTNVVRWVDTCMSRPASRKAVDIPSRD